MPRIQPIDPNAATGKAKELVDAVKAKLGRVPNILATMAQAPVVLKSYLDVSGDLAGGTLPLKLREKIALAIGELNGCKYCVAAHKVFGKMAGLSEEEMEDARKAASSDSKDKAALAFAVAIMKTTGFVSDADMQSVRDAGFSDAEILEIVAAVSLNVFTNFFNHVVDTEVDF